MLRSVLLCEKKKLKKDSINANKNCTSELMCVPAAAAITTSFLESTMVVTSLVRVSGWEE